MTLLGAGAKNGTPKPFLKDKNFGPFGGRWPLTGPKTWKPKFCFQHFWGMVRWVHSESFYYIKLWEEFYFWRICPFVDPSPNWRQFYVHYNSSTVFKYSFMCWKMTLNIEKKLWNIRIPVEIMLWDLWHVHLGTARHIWEAVHWLTVISNVGAAHVWASSIIFICGVG